MPFPVLAAGKAYLGEFQSCYRKETLLASFNLGADISVDGKKALTPHRDKLLCRATLAGERVAQLTAGGAEHGPGKPHP